MTGQTLSHYRITAKLGQGGMGEVYRATDSKLDREVAIKVLPEGFDQTAAVLTRFEREAKALAQLNHPHVAAVHGFDEWEGKHFLVLELVEGEDLSMRLKRGALPVDEALQVGRQIAEALEAAHEKGIIHRDLKPGNIKVTADGQVKVLDFGLAKVSAAALAVCEEGEGAGGSTMTVTEPTTMPGVVLGTAGYMSPEQARGEVVDKRSDIWSFGSVLFECLSGQRAFQGKTVTDTLAAVLHQEPDWSALPAKTPPIIHLLLRKCLAKDRKRRLHDIADARVDLEQAMVDPNSSFIGWNDEALPQWKKARGIPRLMVFGIVCSAVVLTWFLKPKPMQMARPSAPIRQIPAGLDLEGTLSRANGTAVRVSPDGTTLAYIFRSDRSGTNAIYLRRFDELQSRELIDSQRAIDFCFSPDGNWIAFRRESDEEWERISIKDGPAELLCLARQHGRGISWSEDGWIIFGGQDAGGLARAPTQGNGAQEVVTTPTNGVVSHYWPQYLPGSKAVLFTAHTKKREGFDDASIVVKRLPDGKERILKQGYGGRYVESGHLLYVQKGALLAAAFDLDTLTVQGPAITVVPEVATAVNMGIAHFDVSTNGLLAYVRGGIVEPVYQLEWVDREGKSMLLPQIARFEQFRLSPDGHTLAYVERMNGVGNIFIYDTERPGNPRQLTFDSGDCASPVWSPEGKCVLFYSGPLSPGDPMRLCWTRVNESDEVNVLTEISREQFPSSWSQDGRYLALTENPRDNADVRIVHLAGDDSSGWRYLYTSNYWATRFSESNPAFSADGNWLAYTSDEFNPPQVLVRSFPEAGPMWRIRAELESSIPMVRWPRKAATQDLILGFLPGGQVFTAQYRVEGGAFDAGVPSPWEGAIASSMLNRPLRYDTFDVDPSGSRVLIRKLVEGAEMERTLREVVIFESFFDYLRENVPTETK